jgi:hypothetical protein
MTTLVTPAKNAKKSCMINSAFQNGSNRNKSVKSKEPFDESKQRKTLAKFWFWRGFVQVRYYTNCSSIYKKVYPKRFHCQIHLIFILFNPKPHRTNILFRFLNYKSREPLLKRKKLTLVLKLLPQGLFHWINFLGHFLSGF